MLRHVEQVRDVGHVRNVRQVRHTGQGRRRWLTGAVAALIAAALPASPVGAAETRGEQGRHGPLSAESPESTESASSTEDGHAVHGRVMNTLRRMTLEEKVGQLFVTHVHGAAADTANPAHVAANQSAYGVDTPAQVIAKYHLGGVVYVTGAGQPFSEPSKMASLSNGLQRAASRERRPIPLLLAINQEPGARATRITEPATRFPNAMAMGAASKRGHAHAAARVMGRELRAMGVNNNYSPVADVNVNPLNPIIGSRSFGADPDLVSDLTQAQVTGYQSQGVIRQALPRARRHQPRQSH